MRILTLTRLWPNSVEPNLAIFNEHRARALAAVPGLSAHTIAPVPFFPRVPFPRRYAQLSRVPRHEVRFGLSVDHPRYPVIPKIGLRLQGAGLVAATLRDIAAIHEREPIDLLDSHYVYPDGFAAVEIGRRLGIPTLITACGSDVYTTPKTPGMRPYVERALEGATMIVAVSESLARGLRDLGVDPAKIRVIPYGIDGSRFAPDPAGRAAVRARLGLAETDRLVLSVGRLHPVKGHDLLIDAAARIPGVRFAIVGEGAERANTEQRIRERGLEGRVTLVGAIPNEELAPWYSAADLFCLPSRAEGHPNVLIEALACGTPAVATAVGAVPGMIDPSCGLVIPKEDVNALTLGLQAGLAAVRDSLWTREAARAAVRRTWADVAKETIEVFEETVRRFGAAQRSASPTRTSRASGIAEST